MANALPALVNAPVPIFVAPAVVPNHDRATKGVLAMGRAAIVQAITGMNDMYLPLRLAAD